MGLRTLIIIGLLSLFYSRHFSQDYFSYGGGNFSGLNQVIANPAAAADNRLKLDVMLAGFDMTFNNSWFGIRREALDYSGSLAKPSEIRLPASWKNATPNVPDNVFKNFSVVSAVENHAITVETRVLLPSFLLQLNSKNSVAFAWSVRQMGNIEGISQQLATLFEREMDLSVLQNNRVQNKNFTGVQMTWVEYGLTYARVLRDKNAHFFKAGITPKLLQGLESGYLIVRDLDFLFSTKDTLSYFNADFSFAHSSGASTPFKFNFPGGRLYQPVTKLHPGLDLGIIYEWRPQYRKYKYKADGRNYSWRKDLNKYRLRFGASLVDIGKIRFNKDGTYYDLDVSVQQSDITKYTAVTDYKMFDSLLNADFPSRTGSGDFSILLPAAVNTQLDISVNRFLYLNLSAHITDFYRSNVYRVHNYSALCFAPRFEHYWGEVSVPFTYNTLSARRSRNIQTGVNVRLGPVNFGTSDVVPWFKGDVAGLNFYVLLKVMIPHKRIRDQDGDKVNDRKDECPDEPGDAALNGCPDKDQDRIPDRSDACPNQPGIAAFKGCPDTDGDSITDSEDRCPLEKGTLALKGCPDLDKDSIADKDDACPETAGLKKFKGCPDTDKDGIIDKEDLCPTVKGLAKYAGCTDRDNDLIHDGIDACPETAGPADNKGCPWPDTDKDGIIDKLDSCINTPGIAAFKGCPAPVQLAPAEKRILQKAFSSLEFESGKDIIKRSSYPSLNALAKLLLSHKADWQLRLSGHTDNEGSASDNLVLSEKRAKAVQAYLIKKGLPVGNTLVEWFGQSRPIADNSTREGRQKNRRVDMTVLMKE